MILEVDPVKRRISLGLKQTLANPWETFAEKYPSARSSRARSRTRPSSACSSASTAMSTAWSTCPTSTGTSPGEQAIEDYNRGDMVKAQVLDVDVEKERISLGIKQVGGDPFADAAASGEIRKGAVVTCEVIDVKEAGIDVKIADTDLTAFIRRSDLSRDRSEQRPERFAKGEKVDARVTNFDKKSRKISRVDQGAGDRRGEGSRRPVRLVRLRRLARRHPRRRAQGARGRRRGRRRLRPAAAAVSRQTCC